MYFCVSLHPLTWRRQDLWPLLQPASRGRWKCFGFTFGGAVMSSIFIYSPWCLTIAGILRQRRTRSSVCCLNCDEWSQQFEVELFSFTFIFQNLCETKCCCFYSLSFVQMKQMKVYCVTYWALDLLVDGFCLDRTRLDVPPTSCLCARLS